MTIYVDHARIPYRRMRMSHLLADTREELERARDALGLPADSIQKTGTPQEHLDVCETKRDAAIRIGAVPVSSRKLVSIIRQRRKRNQHDAPNDQERNLE